MKGRPTQESGKAQMAILQEFSLDMRTTFIIIGSIDLLMLLQPRLARLHPPVSSFHSPDITFTFLARLTLLHVPASTHRHHVSQ